MPRPRKKRFCRRFGTDRVFKPQGIPMTELEIIEIPVDAFEAMRLCDHEGLDQSAAGEVMGVSRGTVQRLLYQGRKQIVEALLKNSAVTINFKKNEDENVSMYTHGRRKRDGCPHT